MKIIYWSDFVCPFCYIGEANLMNALKRAGLIDKVEVEMKAFQLNPYPVKEADANPIKVMSKKYGISEEKAAKRLAETNIRGREAGLDMHCEMMKKVNTFDAHRLTKYAQSLGDQKVTDALIQLLFKNVFTINSNISDHDVLLKIAEEAGLKDLKKVKEVLDSEEFADEVRYEERQAQQIGVRGVPFFIIGDNAVPGAHPIEEMERIIKTAYEKSSDIKTESKGATCTESGCTVK